ncbi:MAG TPA: hypothetical protein HA254_02350 [Candidatus Diapherotrites archaeon]|uniref:Uncharacterized protein n=1 Tax=Candidatus Iainarchaeum sp. TaxID=3101447 RepID=A0A7J4IVC9_9ARCH|nr:hypothetical protein [Candidatus Diapherotrites archaeon]
MGWYGVFLVPKLKLCFYLRKVDEGILESSFDSMDRFFDKYDKVREDIEYVLDITEESKTFSAKATAKMFNTIEEIGRIPEASNSIFLLYFLKKHEFEINYHPEDAIDLDKLKAEGWQIIEYV